MGSGFETDRDEYFDAPKLNDIVDTPPYLHDGRAMTLTEAILFHGGEAQDARDSFEQLSERRKDNLMAFLYSLRTPLPDNHVDKKKERQLLKSIK